jgi:broad specificity phosphatase PhoE
VRSLFLARHGESVFSVRGLLNGDPGVPGGLTPAGMAQARRLGEALAAERIDLCVTSELQRTIETADEALRGREVPRLVVAELNDPRYGPYEGSTLEDYRTWASAHGSREGPGSGGESRFAIVDRYTRAYRALLHRPDDTILVVAHSLPIAYLIGARDGVQPAPRVPLTAYATAYRFSAVELEAAVAVLELWLATPTW